MFGSSILFFFCRRRYDAHDWACQKMCGVDPSAFHGYIECLRDSNASAADVLKEAVSLLRTDLLEEHVRATHRQSTAHVEFND